MVRVAVIGLVGRSMFFGVPRFHQGGETITAKSFYEEWGGKGFNQAVAAVRQGARVSFLGAVNSADEKSLKLFCRKEKIDAQLCLKKDPSATAAILTDGTGETRVTVCPGAELCAKDVKSFAKAIAAADYLLLGNEVPEAVNLAAIKIAKKSGTKIVYNPAPARKLPKKILESVDIFTPNEFERESLELGARSLEDERDQGQSQSSKLQAPNSKLLALSSKIITTLGAKGCRIESTGEVIPAPKVKAVDSTGAGDTFNAMLVVCLAEGFPLAAACREAVKAASKSVTRRFVMPSIPYRN